MFCLSNLCWALRGYSRRGQPRHPSGQCGPSWVSSRSKITRLTRTLDTFYVLHANWFYKMMFGIVKTFINKRTADKFKVIDNF